MADLELLPCPASPERKAMHMASLRNDHNSQLKLQFLLNLYCFCLIIKVRNHKSEPVHLYSYRQEQLLQILLKKILKIHIQFLLNLYCFCLIIKARNHVRTSPSVLLQARTTFTNTIEKILKIHIFGYVK